jgi:hypothetical protein
MEPVTVVLDDNPRINGTEIIKCNICDNQIEYIYSVTINEGNTVFKCRDCGILKCDVCYQHIDNIYHGKLVNSKYFIECDNCHEPRYEHLFLILLTGVLAGLAMLCDIGGYTFSW